MDWTNVVLIIFATCVALFITVMIIGLRYVKKLVNWLTRPLTSRPVRR